MIQEWKNATTDNIPARDDLDLKIVNASPFERIMVKDISKLTDIKQDATPSVLLENLLFNNPPCCKGDVNPEQIENGLFGEREQYLYLRSRDGALALDKLDQLTLLYDMYLCDESNSLDSERILKRKAEIARLRNVYSEHYRLVLTELVARTSCRNLVPIREAHPESSHCDPQLAIEDSLTHCYGWVARVVDLLAQVQNREELSPLTSDLNGNYTMKDGEKMINYNTILNWFMNEAVDSGWTDETNSSYDEMVLNGDNKMYVCFGTVRSEGRVGTKYDRDHVFIARKLPSLDGSGSLMVAAELMADIPGGSLFIPINPNHSFKIVGNEDFKVLKFSCSIL